MPAATILVVDDDPVIQKLLHVNFQMEGYDVVMAGDGQEAVDKARSARPDLIVLDVMMPKLDGLQVASILKSDEATASIPIIMLSAKAQDFDVKAGMAAGADDYITKPFDPLQLLARAAELMGKD
ncbi:MAG TPA: response regulator [Acidimicrobiales bacterium]|nr:response regulator [Acidimicrobiales bacterium]